MIQSRALRFPQIMQNRGGGAGGERSIFEAAAVEREKVEMIAETARGVIRAEHPRLDCGFQTGQREGGGLRDESFAGVESFEGGGNFREIDFGSAEFAGGKIDVGDT